MRHSLPQVTVDKTKNYPTQLYGYLAIRFGQINIIYPQKSPASLEIRGLQDFNNYSHSIVAGGLEVISYTIRFTCFTSFTILTEIRSKTS